MRKSKNINGVASLVQKAEEYLKNADTSKAGAYTYEGVQKLVHELQMHQIELEMQNEQLREAEEQARINAEKYSALYDFFPAGYCSLNREGQISELNLAAAKMLGKERGILIGQSFMSFLKRYTKPVFDNFLKDVFVTHTRQSCEVRLSMDGNPSSYLFLEGIIADDEHSCYLSAVDITSYKEGVENLRQSEIRYRRLFEAARDGILILDAISGQIVDVNPFIIQLLGYSYDELLGKELWEIGTFKNIGYSQFAFIELQIRGEIRYEDMPLVTKDGKSINVEFVSNVYVSEHEKVIQCNIRNITRRKQLEKSLRESETRLLELNATKDKFFSIIAHDLRGPFNSILGFSELLIERIRDKDYDGVEKYASIINQSSQRAMELVTNLLEWSRSKVGRMQFNPEETDMVALITSVAQLLRDTADKKLITIYTETPTALMIYADKAMIAATLRNLISNAIKFTHPQGEIVISAQSEPNQLIVMVADNGVGIKKEAISKLFNIEDSYSTPGTADEKGTGLGLMLCKEFIERHGGQIRVESEPRKGSKFYFSIPTNLKKSTHQSQHQQKH